MTSRELRTLIDAAGPRCAKCTARATSVEWTTADGRYPDPGDVVATFLCEDHGFAGDSYWLRFDDLVADPRKWERQLDGKTWGKGLMAALASDLRRLSLIGAESYAVPYEIYILSDPPLVKVGIAKNSAKRSQ